MIIRKSDLKAKLLERCHDGAGTVMAHELLFDREVVGLGYLHETVVPLDATIGVHGHTNRQELYLILEGTGAYADDGREVDVGPGDICLYDRNSVTHALRPTGTTPLRMMVIGIDI